MSAKLVAALAATLKQIRCEADDARAPLAGIANVEALDSVIDRIEFGPLTTAQADDLALRLQLASPGLLFNEDPPNTDDSDAAELDDEPEIDPGVARAAAADVGDAVAEQLRQIGEAAKSTATLFAAPRQVLDASRIEAHLREALICPADGDLLAHARVVGAAFQWAVMLRAHSLGQLEGQPRRLVLIESPFANNASGKAYARRCLADSIGRGEAPLASHLLYTQVLDDKIPLQRATGIELGLLWGRLAAATIVYADHGVSPGMEHGIERANRDGRPVEIRKLGDA